MHFGEGDTEVKFIDLCITGPPGSRSQGSFWKEELGHCIKCLRVQEDFKRMSLADDFSSF